MGWHGQNLLVPARRRLSLYCISVIDGKAPQNGSTWSLPSRVETRSQKSLASENLRQLVRRLARIDLPRAGVPDTR